MIYAKRAVEPPAENGESYRISIDDVMEPVYRKEEENEQGDSGQD